LQGGVLSERHEIHANQDDGHEYEKNTVILFDFWHGFFLGFHGDVIVSQLSFSTIVRADSVRRYSIRLPEGAIVRRGDRILMQAQDHQSDKLSR
jgi:hypothetical protein